MYENKKGLWLDREDDIYGPKTILENKYKLSIVLVETIEEALEEIRTGNYDYFILEPMIMYSSRSPELIDIAKPFREKILDRLMKDETKPIILATTARGIWEDQELTKNVKIIHGLITAESIIDALDELFKKMSPNIATLTQLAERPIF
jgi:hypothetical protein